MKQIDMSEMKLIEISILDEIDRFCKERGITYFLFVGTLLGAVRHKGFIPWDDDIDICMKREDYEKFFHDFNINRDDSLFAVNCDNDDEYYLASGKVIETRTLLIEEKDAAPIGVYVDVFPLDRLPNNKVKFNWLYARTFLLNAVLIAKNMDDRPRAAYKMMFRDGLRLLSKKISRTQILKCISTLAQKYNGCDSCTKIGDISVFTYGMRELYDAVDFSETVELEFEGKYYTAPSGYKNILSKTFGDYMQLPPVEKQISHHPHKVYWKDGQAPYI